MTAPLKNVTVEELEKKIAEALQCYLDEHLKLTVQIGELKYDEVVNRVDVKLFAWSKHKDGVYGNIF